MNGYLTNNGETDIKAKPLSKNKFLYTMGSSRKAEVQYFADIAKDPEYSAKKKHKPFMEKEEHTGSKFLRKLLSEGSQIIRLGATKKSAEEAPKEQSSLLSNTKVPTESLVWSQGIASAVPPPANIDPKSHIPQQIKPEAEQPLDKLAKEFAEASTRTVQTADQVIEALDRLLRARRDDHDRLLRARRDDHDRNKKILDQIEEKLAALDIRTSS